MALIGYARISTGEQSTAAQTRKLEEHGCQVVHEEVASGASMSRPKLEQLLRTIEKGDTLVVVRIDRLARSLKHLLSIMEALKNRGAGLRAIEEPIDTTSAQGMLLIQLVGAFAEFEARLIRERTKEGLAAARARGAQIGNPLMRRRDPVSIAELSIAAKTRYLYELVDGKNAWLPTVERLRPALSWPIVLRQLRAIKPPVRSFTERSLVKACKTLVAAGYARPEILERAPPLPPDDRVARLVADRLASNPNASLRELAAWLGRDLREPTPRGSLKWSAEGVRREIAKARRLGLLDVHSKPDSGNENVHSVRTQ
jgi:DNA invertase Pin-like site-specific DNA recombinase